MKSSINLFIEPKKGTFELGKTPPNPWPLWQVKGARTILQKINVKHEIESWGVAKKNLGASRAVKKCVPAEVPSSAQNKALVKKRQQNLLGTLTEDKSLHCADSLGKTVQIRRIRNLSIEICKNKHRGTLQISLYRLTRRWKNTIQKKTPIHRIRSINEKLKISIGVEIETFCQEYFIGGRVWSLPFFKILEADLHKR